MLPRFLPTLAAALAAALVMAGSTPASAQGLAGFGVDRFEPAERNGEWFAADTLDLRGDFRPSLGLVLGGQYRPLVVHRADGGITSVVRDLWTLHAGAAVNLAGRVRFGLDVPIVLFDDGTSASVGAKTLLAPDAAQTVGDTRLALDVRLAGEHGDPATLALGARLWLPTGTPENYVSDGTVRAEPRIAAAGDVGVFTWAANAGFHFGRPERWVGSTKLGQELRLGAAAGLRLLGGRLVVGPELGFGAVVLSEPATPAPVNAPASGGAIALEGIFGAHFTAGMVRFGAGAGAGFTDAPGTPTFRVLLGIELVPPVEAPAPPPPPPKPTLPPPADDDHDGISNGADACPSIAGDPNVDPRRNGCPADQDQDGFPDRVDACPTVPGVESSDPKRLGCPSDRDEDGIWDKEDACLDEKGVASSVPTFNGCPADVDKDGVANEVDACPREAGKPNPDPAKNGCPTAYIASGVIKILDQVQFKPGSAELQPGGASEEILLAVLAVLRDHPEIKKLSIEGHTDRSGDPRLNKLLSGKRAAAVVKWLAQHGVAADRLSSIGWGSERPIAENATEAGRRLNRRVEFHIVDPPTH